MVKFNDDNTFTVSIEGCNGAYIDTIKALLTYVGQGDDNYISQNELYYISNLIASMLPNPEQIINKEDAELLKIAKQNKAIVDTIIGKE